MTCGARCVSLGAVRGRRSLARRPSACAAATAAALDTSDLWVEDEFSRPARLLPQGREYGKREGWRPGPGGEAAPVHSVRITSRDGQSVYTVASAEDRYVLFEAEEQGLSLPAACRMGCCTACAVKVTSGTILQPQALGISAGLRADGYALLCVGVATRRAERRRHPPRPAVAHSTAPQRRDGGAAVPRRGVRPPVRRVVRGAGHRQARAQRRARRLRARDRGRRGVSCCTAAVHAKYDSGGAQVGGANGGA